MAIAYRKINLHTKREQPESNAFEQWLNANLVAFNLLDYENPSECLIALSTWFYDDEGNRVIFDRAPVLTYDEVIWEAPDKSDAYIKVRYAVSPSDLPADFPQLSAF
jgi:hypothetical protein